MNVPIVQLINLIKVQTQEDVLRNAMLHLIKTLNNAYLLKMIALMYSYLMGLLVYHLAERANY